MQHLSRTVSPALPHPCLRALRAAFPQTIPVLAGYFVLGLGYGIYVQSLGLPVWMPMLMGTVVYAARWNSYWPAFCWEHSRRCRPF